MRHVLYNWHYELDEGPHILEISLSMIRWTSSIRQLAYELEDEPQVLDN